MANLTTNIAGLTLKNPVLTASGTFGYGTEFSDFIDLERLGGFIVKGTTLHPRQGNPYPRLAETPSGMINAVGLQNKGVAYYIEHIHPQLASLKTNVIVNLSGSCIEDYVEGARMLNEVETIPAIELNISCPNVKAGGMGFGTKPEMAAEVVREGSHLTFQAIALPEEEAVIEHVEYDRIDQHTQLQLAILVEEDVDERQGHHQEQHDEEFPYHTVSLETLCLAHQAQRIQFESGLWYCKRCQPEEVHREDGYHTGQHVNGLYALYHSFRNAVSSKAAHPCSGSGANRRCHPNTPV